MVASDAGRQRAQRPHREDQDPLAPLTRLRRARGGAEDEDAGAAVEIGAQLGAAGDDVAAVGDLAGEDGGDEGAGDLLARPLGRARALQLQRQQGGDHPRDRRLRRRRGPVAQLTDGGIGDPQLDAGHAVAAGKQPLLLVGRGAGDRENGAGAVDQGDAGVQQAGGRARHRGQAGTRLDRFRERVEEARISRICRAFSPF